MLAAFFSLIYLGHNVIHRQGTGLYSEIEMTSDFLAGLITSGGVDLYDRATLSHQATITGWGYEAKKVALVGNYLCVHESSNIQFYDVAEASDPHLAGFLSIDPVWIGSWADKLVVLLRSAELVVYDLADISNPNPVSSVTLSQTYVDFSIDGDTLFLRGSGIALANMNDLETLTHHNIYPWWTHLVVDGSLFFITEGSRVFEYEFNGPSDVSYVATHEGFPTPIESLQVEAPILTISSRDSLYAYERNGSTFEHQGVMVFPINDRPEPDRIDGQVIADGSVYVQCYRTGIRRFELKDIQSLPQMRYRSQNPYRKVGEASGVVLALQTSGDLDILEVSDPSNPVTLLSIAGYNMVDFIVDGTRLFAATGSTVETFDISDIVQPQWKGAIAAPVSVLRIDFPLLAGVEQELSHSNNVRIFDVSSIASPVLLSEIPFSSLTQNYTIHDGKMCIGRQLYDLSDPTSPQLAYMFPEDIFRFSGFDYFSYLRYGIQFDNDVTDPFNPVIVSREPHIGPLYLDCIQANGVLYCDNTGRGAITIGDSQSRRKLAVHAVDAGDITDFVIIGHSVVATTREDELVIFDVFQPELPRDSLVGDSDLTFDVDVRGDLMILTRVWHGIEVYDVSGPEVVYKYTIPTTYALGAQFITDQEILVLQFRNSHIFRLEPDYAEFIETRPDIVSDFDGSDKVHFEVSGEHVFHETYDGTVMYKNLDDPSAHASFGPYDHVYQTNKYGNRAVAALRNALILIDASNPASPEHWEIDLGQPEYLGASIHGNLVCASAANWKLVDVTDPASPLVLYEGGLQLLPFSELTEDYAILYGGWKPGVAAFDISDRTSPFNVDYVDTVSAERVAAVGRRLYIAEGWSGRLLVTEHDVCFDRAKIKGLLPSWPNVNNVLDLVSQVNIDCAN